MVVGDSSVGNNNGGISGNMCSSLCNVTPATKALSNFTTDPSILNSPNEVINENLKTIFSIIEGENSESLLKMLKMWVNKAAFKTPSGTLMGIKA